MLCSSFDISIKEVFEDKKKRSMRELCEISFRDIPTAGTLIMFQGETYKVIQVMIDLDIMQEEFYRDSKQRYISLFVTKLEGDY